MSDVVWIALIVFGFLLIVFILLLLFRPATIDRLLENVRAINVNNKGLSITFSDLARQAAEQRGGDVPTAPIGLDLKDVSILWVDDVPENNSLEASMFKELGADVQFARNNTSALEAAQKRVPSLIISDIKRHPETETGLDLPARFNEANQPLPPLIYYTTKRTDEKTPDGHTVTIYPAELLSEAIGALGATA